MNDAPVQTFDRVLLCTVLAFLMLGILMVYSSSTFWGAERYGSSLLFMKSHLIRIFIGCLFMLIASKVDYHFFRLMTPFILLVTFILLMVVLTVPEFHGSHRSLLIAGFRFQPSELMKLVLVFYLAAVFTKKAKAEPMEEKQIFVHYGVILLISALIFCEPDLGSAVVIFLIAIAMFFIAGVPGGSLIKLVWGIIPILAMGMVLFPHQKKRVFDFYKAVFGGGELEYQIKQAMIGLAQGGLTGVGYGEGKQKLLFLPEPFSDFILASLGEELGFIGMCVVFLLLLTILWRGLRIAKRAPDHFGFLVASGVTAMICINAVVNAGVVLNLLPTTGLTFPFLSYGGSSLFVNLVGIGILLNISRQSVMPYREFTDMRSKQVEKGKKTIWRELY